MGILNPPASGVTVRMYRVGLGDCFLLAFPTGQAGQAFYMLIDCGGIFDTENPEQKMMDVASDIAAATGGHIHLLVITHEHWDHLSGFIQASDVFKSMQVHNLWLAWTEDSSNPLAQRLRTAFHYNREILRMVVEDASDSMDTDVTLIMKLLHFFKPSI